MEGKKELGELKDIDINKGTSTIVVNNIRGKGMKEKWWLLRVTDINDSKRRPIENIRNLSENRRKKKRLINRKDSE